MVAALSTIFLLPAPTSAPPSNEPNGSPWNFWFWVSAVSAAVGFVVGISLASGAGEA
jgi:uncharacterized membrane protein YedE/YeeE